MKMQLSKMYIFVHYIVSSALICAVTAAGEDGTLGGQKWWIWMSVLLALLIAIIVGGLLYRRKLHKTIPSDQEKQNKNDDPQSAKQKSNFTSFPPLNDHSNINE
ncbi:unnamed protein product, partial [Meganyctiphanes norvegica]